MQSQVWAAGSTPGPVLDLIQGEVMDPDDRAKLPSGRHFGAIADNWLVSVFSLQQGLAGLATMDRLQLGAYGRAWSQLGMTLHGLSIADPAASGEPILQIPHRVWSQLRFQGLNTFRPGLDARVEPGDRTRAEIVARGAMPVADQSSWITAGVFDRDPASSFGSPIERRALDRSGELHLLADAAGTWGRARFFGEHITHRHRYLTLQDSHGDPIHERAHRTTAGGVGHLLLGKQKVSFGLYWQAQSRTHEGAQYRWPTEYTQDVRKQAVVAQLGSQFDLGHANTLSVDGSFSYGDTQSQARSNTPQVWDLEDQWMWLARPTMPGSSKRFRADVVATADLASLPLPVSITSILGLSRAHQSQNVPGSLRGISHLRGNTPAIRLWDFTQDANAAARGDAAWQRSGRIWATVSTDSKDRKKILDGQGFLGMAVQQKAQQKAQQNTPSKPASSATRSKHRFDLSMGLDHGGVWVPGDGGGAGGIQSDTRTVSHTDPMIAAAWHWHPMRDPQARLSISLRHEPWQPDSEVGNFLRGASGNATVYDWQDDGDGIPEAGEAGALRRRSGGRYHALDPNLRRPNTFEAVVGFKGPQWGPFRMIFRAIGRVLRQRYTVRLAEGGSYTPQSVAEPGGFGHNRGLVPAASHAGQDLTVWARKPGVAGQETYVLGNAAGSDFFLGLEMQWVTVNTKYWFLNLSGSAHLSEGSAPFGFFPDRNDPGAIHESSADPNSAVGARGRYDHDRAFGLNMLVGGHPIPGMTLSLLWRYRDGQPFSRIFIAEELPQGATPIMAVTRGAPRKTFHWTWDVRAAHRFTTHAAAQDWWFEVALDFFNLLGSGTEILEDPRTGPNFRNPLEMVPGRSAMLSLAMGWDG